MLCLALLAHGGAEATADDGRRSAATADQRLTAYVEGTGASAALWLRDNRAGSARRIIAARPSDDPRANLTDFSDPVFSLDGGYVYVNAEAWGTSRAVHQINLQTGTARFVIDGSVMAVIRTGRYRGYLLVQRHQYWPQGGSYNPVYVVRPDGRERFMIPGSDNEDGQTAVAPWLHANGWIAN